MQSKQLQWVFLLSLLTVCWMTNATTIEYFDVYPPFETNLTNTSVIRSDSIYLWIKVLNCPSGSCSCQVDTNKTDVQDPAIFASFWPNIGRALVIGLTPDTFYSFTTSCVGAVKNETRLYRTDVGRPSSPEKFQVQQISTSLRFIWSPPLNPAGDNYFYQLLVSRESTTVNLPTTTLTYETTADFIPGSTHIASIEACNIDNTNSTLCSWRNSIVYSMDETTTIATTTTPGSIGASVYSICHFSLILSFLSLLTMS